MNRCAALLLLCALVAAAAVVGAPAPAPKPSSVWSNGWDRPVDPRGDCRFDREGDKLTITVPGPHAFLFRREGARHVLNSTSTAPLLLRDVEGDFAVQVRVKGTTYPRLSDPTSSSYVGLLLLDGAALLSYRLYHDPQGSPSYLSLERRGEKVTTMDSRDGQKWENEGRTWSHPPQKLKFGVVADLSGAATFKATFDEFKLTPLGADGKPLGGKTP